MKEHFKSFIREGVQDNEYIQETVYEQNVIIAMRLTRIKGASKWWTNHCLQVDQRKPVREGL
jgi:hypothetical protein